MKNNKPNKRVVCRIMLCLCLILNSWTLKGEIIYLNNFDGLNHPLTELELNNPSVIDPAVRKTSITTDHHEWGISTINGNRGFVVPSFEATINLRLELAKCKKLEIKKISFKISSLGGFIRISVNGTKYGDDITTGRPYATINLPTTFSGSGPINITIEKFNTLTIAGDYVFLDDLIIEGNFSDFQTPLETLKFIEPSSNMERCQQEGKVTYNAIMSPSTYFQKIRYTLDENSILAGVAIDDISGTTTYPATFYGETQIKATVTGCQNQSNSVIYPVQVRPGGLPETDMDFPIYFTDSYSGVIKNGCYVGGTLSSRDFPHKQALVKVRFTNGVRSYQISAPTNDDNHIITASLYFSQSDFDNYSGALPLPTGSSDTQGKANLRVTVFNALSELTEIILPTSMVWDPKTKRWVLTMAANYAPFSVFLSDAKTVLPVKLEYIAAKAIPEGNRISWKTTEEINFSHFEIEKSDDPRRGFQYLASVSSAKNQYGSTYHYTDVPSSALMQYYRLKMVDFDGSFEHSKIVTAAGQLNEEPLLVYPNPAQNHIFLQSPDAVKSVRLVDQKGNEVFSRSFLDESKSLGIPLPKLNAGAYYLKVNSGAENQQVRKVLIR